jgi:hypothetical protein
MRRKAAARAALFSRRILKPFLREGVGMLGETAAALGLFFQAG